MMSRVLFAASEMLPLVKTGGLADVAQALPDALARVGTDVRVIIPAYRGLAAKLRDLQVITRFRIRHHQVNILEGKLDGFQPPVWLFECAELFEREGKPYTDRWGRDFGDNGWRFGVFSEGVARLGMGAAGWQPDVVHSNDWHTGLVSAWLSVMPRRPRTVFTIHNLAYQGRFSGELAMYLGLPGHLWHQEGIEYYGDINFMKGGINCSDQVTTVSPTYAREIQTSGFGEGLDGVLRHHAGKLTGILNGIDTAIWNPATDTRIETNFTAGTVTMGKAANKAALQARLGLKQDPSAMLIGVISRLTWQKGTDVLLRELPWLLDHPVQFAILGAGEGDQEHGFSELCGRHQGQVGVWIGYDETLAHQIEAGSDCFLMPSRFEPCGLNQMYSQAYGTLPLVRATGGLADTVSDEPGRATGVRYYQLDGTALHYAVREALSICGNPQRLKDYRQRGMQQDFSWNRAASAYQALYAG